MGTDATHEEGVGRIPPRGVPQADGAATAEWTARMLGLPPTGGCDDRGGFPGGGDLRFPPPEHSHAVYCN